MQKPHQPTAQEAILENTEIFSKHRISQLQRLYLGFQGEHFVMGHLFASGFEGFKPPGDFGFDVIVTNQLEQSTKPGSEERIVEFPYALQVKSRRATPNMFKPGPSGRSEGILAFPIKNIDVRLLTETPNAFLVLAGFYKRDAASRDSSFLIWVGQKQIVGLAEGGYFTTHPEFEGYSEISVGLRLFPTQKRQALIKALVTQKSISNEGIRIIESILPEDLPTKLKAREYLSFVRPSKDLPITPVFREISGEFQNLRSIGHKVRLQLG